MAKKDNIWMLHKSFDVVEGHSVEVTSHPIQLIDTDKMVCMLPQSQSESSSTYEECHRAL